ncbi:MAG: UDP-galactopyranose mutase [Rikenella sp.]|nr:UDP-galactopyranose mutase [Rikenella sp.]
MKQYDYLIVGAGLYGACFAHQAGLKEKRCLVIDRREHIGGNLYCRNAEGIHVHQYGAHIFHTSDREVWEYVNSLAEFNCYINSPVAIYKDRLYNLPFNMNTFYQMWGVRTPAQAVAKIEEQRAEMAGRTPVNLEEQAISLVGRDIYEKLIKGYTEKQWGRACTELPPFIIKRLPVRLTFDNNYFNDAYQGIPVGGYNVLIEKMLAKADVRLGVDYLAGKSDWDTLADKVVFTGMIDEYYGYRFGKLAYRTLRFEEEWLETENFQGNAVVNYTEREIPYTRIIEHKHFEFGTQPHTVITREYPGEWCEGAEPYYPINDTRNDRLYKQYSDLAAGEENVIFGGRLAQYQYFDMHHVIKQVLQLKSTI